MNLLWSDKKLWIKFARLPILVLVLGVFMYQNKLCAQELNYGEYHLSVIKAEEFIAKRQFKSALEIYDSLVKEYPFVFLREYQVASQLACLLGETDKGISYIHQGILSGWSLHSIKSCSTIIRALSPEEWKTEVKSKYSPMRFEYQKKLESPLALQVKKMIQKDQRKAFGAFIRITEKSRVRYAEKVFLPHSKEQISEFLTIMETNPYPGERSIGNNYWMSTILSHHNSISKNFNQKDTLYPNLRDQLLAEITTGYLSPYVFAIIDDWYASTLGRPAYGILVKTDVNNLTEINSNRSNIGLRSIQLRNDLVDVETSTQLDLFLDIGNWLIGKIEI